MSASILAAKCGCRALVDMDMKEKSMFSGTVIGTVELIEILHSDECTSRNKSALSAAEQSLLALSAKLIDGVWKTECIQCKFTERPGFHACNLDCYKGHGPDSHPCPHGTDGWLPILPAKVTP